MAELAAEGTDLISAVAEYYHHYRSIKELDYVVPTSFITCWTWCIWECCRPTTEMSIKRVCMLMEL